MILLDYSFLTVAIGTCLLALASSFIGTISVLTNQSLIGDTIGHASYPGVIFSFIVFQSRSPFLLTLGAAFSGYVSYFLVMFIQKKTQHAYTNILALISATFFGLGMVLKQFIQGNSYFSGASQAGLQRYLFGQAAFIQSEDILIILVISILVIILFYVNFHRYSIYLFDKQFAQLANINIKFLEAITLFSMIGLIAIGLKVVGAILMSSFLIAPAATGLIWGKKYTQTLLISSITSIICAFFGTLLSSLYSGLSTGPTIIVLMSIFAIGSVLVSYILNIVKKRGQHL